jgi:hypothetical protein
MTNPLPAHLATRLCDHCGAPLTNPAWSRIHGTIGGRTIAAAACSDDCMVELLRAETDPPETRWALARMKGIQ